MAKRETNAVRRERERQTAEREWMARYLASQIVDGRDRENYSKFDALLGRFLCEYDANLLPECLRMAANILEQKPRSPGDTLFLSGRSYSPGSDWYDDEIKTAWLKASLPRVLKKLSESVSTHIIAASFLSRHSDSWPSFSEFVEVFRKENPKLHRASDRSLRRSLRRLGYNTRQGKLGRPKGK